MNKTRDKRAEKARNATLKALALTEEDLKSIQEAVVAAEHHTRGEIAIAVIPESSDYASFELLASVILGAAFFAVLMPFHRLLTQVLSNVIWTPDPALVTALFGCIGFGSIALFFRLVDNPLVDRLIVPPAVREQAVRRRAIRHFVESGAYATAERTGILLFISLAERRVRIVADTGIAEKIAQAEWDIVASSIAKGIKTQTSKDAIREAIAQCGNLLGEHFPPREENPNELADGLMILESGS